MLDSAAKIAGAKLRRIALIGNPNTGKSTLFNVLAGMNARTGNYPGVTVEIKKGRIELQGGPAELIDLPGTYSLAPRSPDELVAVDVLTGARSDVPAVDAVLCVVNATQLNRNLFLVSQLLEIGVPLILVVNMHDVAESRGRPVDAELLSQRLGIPVVLASATRRRGLGEIHAHLERVLQPDEESASRPSARPLPEPFYASCARFRDSLERTDGDERGGTAVAVDARPLPAGYLIERAILDIGGEAEKRIVARFGAATAGELDKVRREIEASCGHPLADIEPSARYDWIAQQLEGVTPDATGPETTLTDRLDGIVTGRLSGPIVFVMCMFLIFQAIYTGGDFLMGWFEEVQGGLVELVKTSMQPGIFRSLVVDGVIGGVGAVLIFVPQIALLFLFLALLEDCGYMARAAFMVDRAMAGLGLSGRSFLPLMSSFACAVPGVMATRTIDNRRDRLVTMMIAPLMSCSARLPVYLLLIEAFVPDAMLLGGILSQQALVLMAMYLVGVAVAIPVAWLLKKTLLRGEPAPFVLELPEYKVPGARVVLDRVWTSVKAFVIRAGSLIFWATILIWLAGYLPGDHSRLYALQTQLETAEAEEAAPVPASGEAREELEEQIQLEQSQLLENSLLGRAGHAIQPLIHPLGWDWRIGVGVLASFPAREVIISTLGTIYSLGGDIDEEDGGLIEALRESRWPNGEPVFTIPVALSIMVFFALCSQCASTLLVIKKETQSWRWPLFCFTYMTVLAYIGAWLTYTIGTMISNLS